MGLLRGLIFVFPKNRAGLRHIEGHKLLLHIRSPTLFMLESLVGAEGGPGVCPSPSLRGKPQAPGIYPAASLNDLLAGCFLRDKLDKLESKAFGSINGTATPTVQQQRAGLLH